MRKIIDALTTDRGRRRNVGSLSIESPNPSDTHDEIEHVDINALLEQLPPTHPAREAYGRGAGTIELTHLVADWAELVDDLKDEAAPSAAPDFLMSCRRRLKMSSSSRKPRCLREPMASTSAPFPWAGWAIALACRSIALSQYFTAPLGLAKRMRLQVDSIAGTT